MTFIECLPLILWPLVALIIAVFFLILFKDSIASLIKNLKIQTPKGLSISGQAQEALNAEFAGDFISLEDQQRLVEHIQGLETLADQKIQLERVLQQFYQDKQRFEFLWINQVLSANQKGGLLFVQQESPFIEYFKATMLKYGVSNIEWLITFLKNYDLIAIHDMMMSITPKGQQFIGFVDYLREVNGPDALKSLFEQGYNAGMYDA